MIIKEGRRGGCATDNNLLKPFAPRASTGRHMLNEVLVMVVIRGAEARPVL